MSDLLRLLIGLCLGLACTPAFAASFDCGQAKTAVERAVCADSELSALDEDLARVWGAALKRQSDDEAIEALRAEQRNWLKNRRVGDLKWAYEYRIQRLGELPEFPAWNAPGVEPGYRLSDISRQYDFILRLVDVRKATDWSLEGSGQVFVFKKGDAAPMQQIIMGNIYVSLESNKPLVNAARRYDAQGAINVGDFNFDGHDDFGIQNGNFGGYGAPTYDIFLFNPKLGRFEYNAPMSDLIAETQGFFEVDAKRKRLHTMSKGGCCYHVWSTWAVVNNTPEEVASQTEEAVFDPDGNAPPRLKITDRRLVKGKWRERTHYEKVKDE
ncbi:MAG: lysozyme inhibitor LprI family protein [Zoogloeaceae bacterium]|jgi:uncharacterized protein|nr:lysozyme inhibitor LprI family protein [Zoogloeaceae bacterium]